ncbi:unnamed protein product [Prorocentrum cordatum]|uniref:Uncharacterized protein n=1 Tax=Prorocentrum cordatum TaxID=2364126 RepID=A0ABN9Q8Y1_9DINO|nr:unnamed protein product [Polarella glacialis]
MRCADPASASVDLASIGVDSQGPTSWDGRLPRVAAGRGGSARAGGRPPQDTYYFSSRSMVAVTTVDESGNRKTDVKQDQSVRTNIPGLRGGDSNTQRLLSPESTLFGMLDRL